MRGLGYPPRLGAIAGAQAQLTVLQNERRKLQEQVHELNYKIVELNHLIYQEEQKHEH